MTHSELFNDVPVSNTVVAHWAKQDAALLDSAANKIAAAGSNPWVFSADARHFWQFAKDNEKQAMAALTPEEHHAIFGAWDEEDYYPESFGY